ncbi:phage tail protein [Pseudoalteromonas sp. S4498]|uniref:phage tail protein n=1 Tax=Pseudoalteromonas galatheae TaxID=579562 RepID=UPI001109D30E|nr:phage tail protein [Pseudoalteromonas galatheae]NKC18006.1 phage tail protein [Pseudoalteromonas galatheae]
MTKQGKQVRSREANKVKNKLPQVTSLANQVAHLGSLVAKLNANSATSAQIQQLISIMTQLNASAVLSPEASFSVPEFQAPATGENAVPSSQLFQQAEQVMLALPDSLQHAISGLSERVAELDFSAASQTVQVELAALAEHVPSLFNAISVAPAVTAATNASKQSQSVIDAQQQFCLDAASLGQALPDFASSLDLAALPKQLLETGNLLSNIEFAEVLKGELGSLTEAAPALLTQFGFDDAANVVTQFAPAVNQLDIPGLFQGDLQSLQQALPSLLEAVDLKALNQTLAQEIPALAQLDLAGLANGELGSLAATLPNLLEAAGLDGAANSVSAALPALQQLDLGAIADGDIQSLLQSAPALLDALDMQGASQAFGSVLPIAEKLDFKGLMDGELSSLVDAAPEVLRAFELGDAADKLQAAIPGLKQLNLKQIASGDVSSLMAAGPSLLKAFELDGAAGVLEGALPALEKLDVDAILGGDIKSLVSAGPELLSAFGLNDAASVLEQHADLLSNIDLKGVLKGDLSSLTNSLPDLFGEFGLDGISDDLSESFAELEGDVEEKKSTRKKGRKKRGRKRNKRAKSSNLADKQETSADREHKPRKVNKRSANKPALKLLDGGKAPSVKTQLDNQASQPKSKAKAKKVKMMAAANDASYQKLGSFSPAKGGKLGQLFKGSKKLLGRAAAPLSVALGAFDAFTALTDDTLTTKEKTTQVGAAAGGAGGALAGAAAGAAIGSVVPVVGTAIGGLVGGALGAMGGESIGGWFGDKLGGWFSDDAQDSASGTSSPSVTERLLDSATSFATMGPLGLISDTLGGWLSKGDENVAQTDNKTAAISTPQSGEATKNNALDFVKNNVINELNLATGTAAAFAANQGMTTGKIHGVSKAGDLAGRALNAHTVWETLNNDGLSVKEKAAGIGSTLGGMFSADAVSGALSKSKNPYVRMAAPMAGYLTNNMVGDAIKSWFSEDKTSATNESKAPDLNSLNQLNVSANKASEYSSASQPSAASVTVNANITVNAKDGQQAYEVAQQVKQMLDQQQQQAEQELSARYYNQVA